MNTENKVKKKERKLILSKRDAYGEELYLLMLRDFEEIRQRRNNAPKGKPDQYDRIQLDLDKKFESFYKAVL